MISAYKARKIRKKYIKDHVKGMKSFINNAIKISSDSGGRYTDIYPCAFIDECKPYLEEIFEKLKKKGYAVVYFEERRFYRIAW